MAMRTTSGSRRLLELPHDHTHKMNFWTQYILSDLFTKMPSNAINRVIVTLAVVLSFIFLIIDLIDWTRRAEPKPPKKD
jgi:hypothetical protein